ncbi:hypothetical protein [Aquipseudomonas ullengensis]|uniref:Uncharacterized protein n=1 Tax=Aquipseudomonas ullengensis TaxID=2759166 RepID=A0A7W4LMN3_9GAMM|nr:hypothetical protein [Pseudomonas ullengensis]MBB2495954.1 hypothetical protein [Pseudomonas ullengensis]
MATQKQKYGTTTGVAEFFPHQQAELDACIEHAVRSYSIRTESMHTPALAANVEFKRYGPIADSLTELSNLIAEGYSIHPTAHCTLRGMDISLLLIKSERLQQDELADIRKAAALQYEEDRFKRNSAETDRQLQLSLEIEKRRVLRQEEQTLQAQLQQQRQTALDELVSAYHQTAA